MAKWEKFLESEEGTGGGKDKELPKDQHNTIKDEKKLKESNEDIKPENSDKECVTEDDNEVDRDSDGTKSSVGSDYDTDDETKSAKN